MPALEQPHIVEKQPISRDDVSLAQDLVVQSVRTWLSGEQVEPLRRHVRRLGNWRKVARFAISHGIQPVVYRALKLHCADRLPDEVKRDIERRERALSIHNRFVANELGRVIESFERAGIPVLAFKGPVLAHVAYRDRRLRRYTDLDVLIPPQHFARAEEVLQEADYTPFEKVRHLRGVKRHIYYSLAGQWPFKRGNGVFNLDVHVRMMPPGYHYPVEFEAFWERSRPISLGGQTVRCFAAEDMLQILCFHGVKNQWRRLKYVSDVAALIGAEPSMDWDAVMARARAVHGVRVLSLGLLLAQRVLGAPLPSDVLGRLAPDTSLHLLAEKLRGRFIEGFSHVELSYEERVRFHLLMQDTWLNKVRYALYSFARHIWDAWIK